jgi:hypothetical protein
MFVVWFNGCIPNPPSSAREQGEKANTATLNPRMLKNQWDSKVALSLLMQQKSGAKAALGWGILEYHL